MQTAQKISARKLLAKIGTVQQVIVDEVDKDEAICRSAGDAPEIDGNVFIDSNFDRLNQGDILPVLIDESSDYDLWGTPSPNPV